MLLLTASQVPAAAIKQKMLNEKLNPDLLDTPSAPAPARAVAVASGPVVIMVASDSQPMPAGPPAPPPMPSFLDAIKTGKQLRSVSANATKVGPPHPV